MKNLMIFALLSLFIFSCHSSSITQSDTRIYSSISERIQSIPGVQITDDDSNSLVRLKGMETDTTQASDNSPLLSLVASRLEGHFPSLLIF